MKLHLPFRDRQDDSSTTLSEEALKPLHPDFLATASRASPAPFREAAPFPHALFQDLLADGFCQRLLDEFPDFSVANPGKAGARKASYREVTKLGPAFAALDAMLQSKAFLALLSTISGIPNLLYDDLYVGGGTHENLDGSRLDMHVDFNYHPKYHWHRRLNLILFLTEEWEEDWGGCLELQQDPLLPSEHNTTVSYTPALNSAVLFETSERSWHGFRPIRQPEGANTRKTVAVYFYTRTRPAEEIAPEHSTVYIHERLPEQVQAGYTLHQKDIQHLNFLLNIRDHHLRRLYETEKRQAGIIQKLQEKLQGRKGK